MGKEKKKEKKEKKGKKKKKEKKKAKSKSETKKKKSQAVVSKLPPGVSLGNPIDRSADKLFLGTDYCEIYNWQYDRAWAEMLADEELWRPLPFTHGIEMELIIADDNGAYPPGEEMVFRMKEIVKEAIKIMNDILYEGRSDFLPVPNYIRQKVLARPYGKDDVEKGYVMDIRYKLPNDAAVDIDSFGRDGNVTAITYILELVTPYGAKSPKGLNLLANTWRNLHIGLQHYFYWLNRHCHQIYIS